MLSNDPAAEMTIMDPEARAPAGGAFSYLTGTLGGAFSTFANAYANAAANKLAGVNKTATPPAQAVQDSARATSAGSLLSSPWVIGGALVVGALVLVIASRKH